MLHRLSAEPLALRGRHAVRVDQAQRFARFRHAVVLALEVAFARDA